MLALWLCLWLCLATGAAGEHDDEPSFLDQVYSGEWHSQAWLFESVDRGAVMASLSRPRGPRNKEGVELVGGELVLRPGSHQTHRDMRYRLSGRYFPKESELVLFGWPADGSSSSNEEDPDEQEDGTRIIAELLSNSTATADDVMARVAAWKSQSSIGKESQENENEATWLEAWLAEEPWRSCSVLLRLKVEGLRLFLGELEASREEWLLRNEPLPHDLSVEILNSPTQASANHATPRAPLAPSASGFMRNAACPAAAPQLGVVLSMHRDDRSALLRRGLDYCLVAGVAAGLQVVAMHWLGRGLTRASGAKVALSTAVAMLALDAGLACFHGWQAIRHHDLFVPLAAVTFLRVVLVCLYDVRLAFLTWQQRSQAHCSPGFLLYFQVKALMCVAVLAVFLPRRFFWPLLLPLYTFWGPQIVHNIANDVRRPFSTRLIVVYTLLQLFAPVYLYSDPSNFLLMRPNLPFVAFLLFFVCCQAAILILQGHYGPRYLLPVQWFPAKYDYFRQPPLPLSGEMCPICRVEFSDDDEAVVTPCDHVFHLECLQQWTEEQSICPMCRQQVEPI